MVYANGQEPVRSAIEGGFFMGRDNLARLANKGIFWVPTAFAMKAYAINFAHAEPEANLQVVQRNLEHQLGQLPWPVNWGSRWHWVPMPAASASSMANRWSRR